MSTGMSDWRCVIVESPYAGNIEANVAYARAAMADCLHRGEAPFASHLLYTQPGVLRDDIPGERALGINAGFAWGQVADATVVYADLGTTEGMRQGITAADDAGRPVEVRTLRCPCGRSRNPGSATCGENDHLFIPLEPAHLTCARWEKLV